MRILRSILAIIVIAAIIAGVFIYIGSIDNSSDAVLETDSIIINEFMASNRSFLPDDMGEYSDWLEIYNPNEYAVDLLGYGLSNENKTVKWTFPAVKIQPHSYFIVFVSGKGTTDNSAMLQHANFKLKASKGGIYLFNADSVIIDSVEYEGQKSNISLGREPADMSKWVEFTQPTPGFSNDEQGYVEYQQSRIVNGSALIITEIMTSNRTVIADNKGSFSDYIEIFNSGADSIPLSGYAISDDTEKALKWRFPDVTLEPGQYLIIWASGEDQKGTDTPAGYIHTSFRLSAYRDEVVLSDTMGYILDQVSVSEVPSDNAYARVLSEGSYGAEWKVTDKPTPGYANSDEGYAEFENSKN